MTRYDSTLIRGRGNSSWYNSQKKAYRVKFAKKQHFLGEGFANAKSWPLLANDGDKTMIRNALTYDLGRFMGMKFCPGAKFVDLYLNNAYRGTYQISDQVQVHKKRVEVSEQDGWLILTVGKRIAIGQWLQKFEAAVASEDFCDPATGYRAYVDEEDLVNWYVGP